SGRCLALPPSKAAALLFPHARFIAFGNCWKNKTQIHGKKKIQAALLFPHARFIAFGNCWKNKTQIHGKKKIQAALLLPHPRFIGFGNRWKNKRQIHGKKKIQARTADFVVRVSSVAIIATLPYSIVRQPTDRNSGVLFFPLSLSSSACSGGEGNSPSLISPCWREPSTEFPWACGPSEEMKITSSPPRKRESTSPGRGWIPAFAGMTRMGDFQESAGAAPFLPDGLGLSPRPLALIFSEYPGMSPDEQTARCGLIVDRVRMPSDPRARI